MLSWFSKYLRVSSPAAVDSPVEAFMDIQSLCAHYDCDFAAIASLELSKGIRLTNVERTLLHERIHVSQIASTSFGYYYQLLRDAQAATAYNALRKLSEMAPTKIVSPLVHLLNDAEISAMQDGPLPYIENFLNIDLVVLFMLGEGMAYAERIVRDSVQVPLKQQFLMAEKLLGLYLNWSKRLTLTYQPQTGVATWKWPDEDQILELIATTTYGEGYGIGGYNVANVLESWATIAEYWNGDWSERGSYAPLNWKQEIQRHRQMTEHDPNTFWRYWSMIELAERSINASNCNEFVYSFLSIADFALCPPILPFQTELRGTDVTLHDLHPLSRLIKLLRAAKALDPISDPANDYKRFIGELSAKSGLRSPLELARHSQQFMSRVRRDDMISYAYFTSQDMRLGMPELFLKLELFFLPRHELLFGPMQLLYHHPVMSFRDQTIYGIKNEEMKYQVMRFLRNSYARQLMHRERVDIVLPFKERNTDIIDFFRGELTEELKSIGVTPVEFMIKSLETE